MPTLTSTSTLDEIEAEMFSNDDFAETGSVAKAKAFASAARLWLRKVPSATSSNGRSMALNVSAVERDLQRAYQYINVAGDANANGGVKILGVSSTFR